MQSAKIKAVLCDGNGTSQAFFKISHVIPQHPWFTDLGIHLIL